MTELSIACEGGESVTPHLDCGKFPPLENENVQKSCHQNKEKFEHVGDSDFSLPEDFGVPLNEEIYKFITNCITSLQVNPEEMDKSRIQKNRIKNDTSDQQWKKRATPFDGNFFQDRNASEAFHRKFHRNGFQSPVCVNHVNKDVRNTIVQKHSGKICTSPKCTGQRIRGLEFHDRRCVPNITEYDQQKTFPDSNTPKLFPVGNNLFTKHDCSIQKKNDHTNSSYAVEQKEEPFRVISLEKKGNQREKNMSNLVLLSKNSSRFHNQKNFYSHKQQLDCSEQDCTHREKTPISQKIYDGNKVDDSIWPTLLDSRIQSKFCSTQPYKTLQLPWKSVRDRKKKKRNINRKGNHVCVKNSGLECNEKLSSVKAFYNHEQEANSKRNCQDKNFQGFSKSERNYATNKRQWRAKHEINTNEPEKNSSKRSDPQLPLQLTTSFSPPPPPGLNDPNVQTALLRGAFLGRVDIIEACLRKGADPVYTDRVGRTALHYAAAVGQTDGIERLLDHIKTQRVPDHSKSDEDHIKPTLNCWRKWVNLRDKKFWSPLLIAVTKTHIECVKLLLQEGADPKIQLCHRCAPCRSAGVPLASLSSNLFNLASRKSIDIGAIDTMETFPELNSSNDNNVTMGKGYDGTFEIKDKKLVDFRKKITTESINTEALGKNWNESAEMSRNRAYGDVCSSEENSKVRNADTLLDRSSSCEAKGSNDNTKKTADKRNQTWSSAIHFAAIKGNIEISQLLLQFGANVNELDSDKRPALHYAACRENTKYVSWILKQGAFIDLVDINGRNVLHSCALRGEVSNAQLLLEAYGHDSKHPHNCTSWITYKNGYEVDMKSGVLSLTILNLLQQKDKWDILPEELARLHGHHTLYLLLKSYREQHESTLKELRMRVENSQFSRNFANDSNRNAWESLPHDIERALDTAKAFESGSSDDPGLQKTIVDVLATGMQEVKSEKLSRAVRRVGALVCLKAYNKTMVIQSSGGMLTADGSRKKTAGGVFFSVLREFAKLGEIHWNDITYIDMEEVEQKKAIRRRIHQNSSKRDLAERNESLKVSEQPPFQHSYRNAPTSNTFVRETLSTHKKDAHNYADNKQNQMLSLDSTKASVSVNKREKGKQISPSNLTSFLAEEPSKKNHSKTVESLGAFKSTKEKQKNVSKNISESTPYEFKDECDNVFFGNTSIFPSYQSLTQLPMMNPYFSFPMYSMIPYFPMNFSSSFRNYCGNKSTDHPMDENSTLPPLSRANANILQHQVISMMLQQHQYHLLQDQMYQITHQNRSLQSTESPFYNFMKTSQDLQKNSFDDLQRKKQNNLNVTSQQVKKNDEYFDYIAQVHNGASRRVQNEKFPKLRKKTKSYQK